MAAPSVRLGVDIGGTFTDVVLEKDGVPFSTKVLTTYSAPENAIIDGMHQVCAKADVTPAADWPDHSWDHACHECVD